MEPLLQSWNKESVWQHLVQKPEALVLIEKCDKEEATRVLTEQDMEARIAPWKKCFGDRNSKKYGYKEGIEIRVFSLRCPMLVKEEFYG